MIEEVENIIKNKAYTELTGEERKRVSELAQNEEEYNDMRWFLTSTSTAIHADKITASPDLKKNVMAHLTDSKKKKGFWLNSVGIFMLPQNKKLYQKPAFQLGIAAVAIIGFLFVFNKGLNTTELASNDLNENKEMVSPTPEANSDSKNESPATNNIQPLENESADELPSPPPVESIIIADIETVEEEEVMDMFFLESDLEIEDEPNAFAAGNGRAEVLQPSIDDMDGMDEIEISEELKRAEKEEQFGGSSTTRNDITDKNRAERFKRDRKKSKTETYTYSTESTDAPEDDTDNIDSKTNGILDKTQRVTTTKDWILPKALHINQTKELNQLFYLAK